ncbi:MAG: alpha/beta hydrolase [Micrococcaceae bacterium]|nr:alpha/beta hydrolase [Micrococcaceae bacterium]
MIHGNGVDHRLLLPLDPCLADAGAWERIYLDLPGFGGTPALEEPGGLPEIADWLQETIGELVGDRKFAVLGHSLGGVLAAHLAITFGDQMSGMALLAPVVHPRPRDRTVPEKRVLHRDQKFLGLLDPQDARDFEGMAILHTAEAWAAFRDAALPGIRAANARAVMQLSRRYHLAPEAGPGSRAAATVSPRTLILAGRHDHVVGFADQEDLLLRYPQATYVVLEDAGHNIHLDQPERVASFLRAWARALHESAEETQTRSR